ncbi:DUF134 domain-containing protein [Desulfotomaculum copahuensis]|uniref:UPF0251 protein A6M21_13235 n=1 Tax=Desulfotomaculum copahuensis TaxID=1838280 RepID=A0A1B7LCR7_9FIRM|nr:DUF134 domain-containing protein [Desulfotomaculum copahuensis]OAT80706.1 hypothetical protein A6M21_13235 [Desulfotomaculum copahuensis]
MSRPPKCRRVEFLPRLTFFKPAGVPLRDLEEVGLTVEELEAIRLKDLLGLEQEACAEKMGVSRPTYHRVLSAARAKVAEALVNGKAIRVEGGNFQVVVRRFHCEQCGHEWEVPCGQGPCASEMACPQCAGRDVYRIDEEGKPFNCLHWEHGKKMEQL